MSNKLTRELIWTANSDVKGCKLTHTKMTQEQNVQWTDGKIQVCQTPSQNFYLILFIMAHITSMMAYIAQESHLVTTYNVGRSLGGV